jgi:protein O-mannosyl-transferase
MKARRVPTRKRQAAPKSDLSRTPVILTCVLVALAILAAYSRTFAYGFVSFDDGTYVYQNSMVKAGVSFRSLAWAFTTFYASNWHPLTWISYMLDAELFGLSAGEQHAVNVFLHLCSSILLFLALERMTKQRWRCALVAGIFALHPLHVESVAWIAERKDVLSAFFQMLTLWLYVRYTEDSKPVRYVLLAGAFALSLLSKPTAVTLPFVLILLDVWPLRRPRRIWEEIVEKAPLFAMSAAASILTLFAQRNTGAMMSLARLSLADRLGSAIVGYLRYVGKAFWPANLAVLYPIQKPSPLAVSVAALVLVAVTAAALLAFQRRPYALVGWLWFLGMLLPVIGLVQVGFQSIADRYTYVPLVGLSIAVIWTVSETVASQPRLRHAAATAAVIALVALAIGTYEQTQYWKDSITLFEHTIAVTNGNYIIHNNLGIDLQAAGRLREATEQFRLAIAADPEYKDALNSLGAILAYQGDKAQAIALHRRAIAADPNYANAHINLGHELLETGQTQEAFVELSRALRLEPDSARGQAYMGAVLMIQGELEESRQHLQYSLRLTPENADAQSNLCYVLRRLGHPGEAIDACRAALKMRPNLASAQLNLGNALAAAGQTDAAAAVFSRMLSTNPNDAGAQAALANLGRSRDR